MYQHLRNCLKQTAFMLALLVSSNSMLQAQNWDKVIKAVAGDRENRSLTSRSPYDYYGRSVAISGDYAVVGANGEDEDENESNYISSTGYGNASAGAAYILRKENGYWKTIKKICAPVRVADDNFGYSVAIDGDYVVICAQRDLGTSVSYSGAAYIFKKDQGGIGNWGFVKKVVTPNAGTDDNFGVSVAINGSYLAISAPMEDILDGTLLVDAGAVYLFEKDQGGMENWGLRKRIVPTSSNSISTFGVSLSINNDYLLIGEPTGRALVDGNEVMSPGAAYLFKKDHGGGNNWGQLKKFTAPNRTAFDAFGGAVALSDEYIVIGALREDEDENESNTLSEAGSVYIFKKTEGGADNWGQIKKIVVQDRQSGDYFGYSVSIHNDIVAVGATLEDRYNYDENGGGIYLFAKDNGGADNWGQFKKLLTPPKNSLDNFRYPFAFNDTNLIVGVHSESKDEIGANTVPFAGAALIYNKDQGGNNNWGLVQKTVTMDRMTNDFFGSAVAISGNYAVVGVYQEDEDVNGLNTLNDAGAAYIFYNNSGIWTQVKKLTAPVRSAGAYFGYSVSIEGDYIIVGSSRESSIGAVYLYRKDEGGAGNWGQIKKLVPSDGSFDDNYGLSVAISGGYALVGAPWHDYAGANSYVNAAGAAYLYKLNGSNDWDFVRKITAMTREVEDSFGDAVAIKGDYLIIGATGEDHDINENNYLAYAGASYIFKKNKGGADNWGQIQKLTEPNRVGGAYFGGAVSIDNENLVVGARQQSAAYVFRKDETNDENWVLSKRILPPNTSVSVSFGNSVSISGDNIIVSAHGDQLDASESNSLYFAGAAHIFNKNSGGANNWGHVKKLTSPNRAYGDQFGMFVSISGDQVIVSSLKDDEDVNEKNFLTNAGSVYFFERACSEPLTLASSNITNKTATISWAEPLTVPGGGYEYYYSTSSTTPADNVTVSGSTSTGTTSANLNGLQPATTYYFWVRSSCSVGYASVWVAGGSFTTEACPATIAELTIPTEVGTYQSVNTIQEGNLTHYCDCANNLLLLTLDKTGSGAVIPDNSVKVKVGGGASYYSNGTGFVTNTHGTAMFNRWWSVIPTTQPTSSVKVRTYYTPADFTAVNSTLTSNGKAPMGSESQMFFYKVTDSSLGEFPLVSDVGSDKVILITNGLSAGLNSWVKGSFGDDSYGEFLVSSFSGGGGGGSPSEALPVTLVSFKALKKELATELKWSTSSESNAAYFGIERSSDGQTWSNLGEEPAAGESSGVRNYTFTDSRPLSGKNYYRLKSVDRDGTFALSRIEQVTFSGDGTLVLYPNPVSEKLYLKGTGAIASVEIINGLGQVVSQTSGYPKEGVSTSKLNPGLYSVRVNMVDGSSQFHKVVVIK